MLNQILILENYLITNHNKIANDNVRNYVPYSSYYTFHLVVVNNILLNGKFPIINSV